MRDQMKVIIGFGSIWGLFAFGAVLFSSFTMGVNDTAPEVLAVTLYGLTILPACLLAIWFRRGFAFWLLFLAVLTTYGLGYQMIVEFKREPSHISFGGIAAAIFLAVIPALLGIFMLRTPPLMKDVEPYA